MNLPKHEKKSVEKLKRRIKSLSLHQPASGCEKPCSNNNNNKNDDDDDDNKYIHKLYEFKKTKNTRQINKQINR